jgi:ferredoxin
MEGSDHRWYLRDVKCLMVRGMIPDCGLGPVASTNHAAGIARIAGKSRMTDLSEVKNLLRPHGLVVLGVSPETMLVGNAGSSFWSRFERSPEYSDGHPHPMDRWSKRIGLAVATELGAEAIFPFEGPPYPPILQWAKAAGQAFPSPVSMFIHHEYGLWHAYRFALRFPQPLLGPFPAPGKVSPCLSCNDQPCLAACPVDAFSENSYRVDDCVDFLVSHESSECWENGCGARKACPVATEYQFHSIHARFHMDAFVRET